MVIKLKLMNINYNEFYLYLMFIILISVAGHSWLHGKIPGFKIFSWFNKIA
jgi:hypothetical protein